jgi:hypothetical protein
MSLQGKGRIALNDRLLMNVSGRYLIEETLNEAIAVIKCDDCGWKQTELEYQIGGGNNSLLLPEMVIGDHTIEILVQDKAKRFSNTIKHKVNVVPERYKIRVAPTFFGKTIYNCQLKFMMEVRESNLRRIY